MLFHGFFNFEREVNMASWGCPHEIDGKCTRVNNLTCDPGMKGCVLAGRFVFANSDEKSARFLEKKARESAPETLKNKIEKSE